MSGFLAIWSDVAEAQETDYLHWLTREHTAERVSIPGFLGVRVFRARIQDGPRFFIFYTLQNADVVASEPYVQRLNAPTEWSRRIMPILQNFARGGGRIVAAAGEGQGSVAVPIVCPIGDLQLARASLDPVRAVERMVAVRLCEVDLSRSGIATNEKSMRRDDRTFEGLVLLEALDHSALDAAIGVMKTATQLSGPMIHYDQIFALSKAELVTAPR